MRQPTHSPNPQNYKGNLAYQKADPNHFLMNRQKKSRMDVRRFLHENSGFPNRGDRGWRTGIFPESENEVTGTRVPTKRQLPKVLFSGLAVRTLHHVSGCSSGFFIAQRLT
jgi:hypothetical protein